MRQTPITVLAAACLLLVALSPAVCGADEGPLARLHVSSASIEWLPLEASYERLMLTVSGPDDFYLERELGPGEPPSISLFDLAGTPLRDGVYTYELRLAPRVSESLRAEMAAAREPGDAARLAELRSAAGLPAKPQVQSGHFSVRGGAFVSPVTEEEREGAALQTRNQPETPALATRDQLIYDDLIVTGSVCVGFDCVNGESFGYDTIKLKENNLRIKFEDTSGGTFPTNDWRLTANSSGSGGLSYFAIDDVDGGVTPFTLEAGAPANSLYLDDYGRVGLGTSIPYVELHIVDGDSPAIRLDQDGSSGWTVQRWDLAGNETNFFVRDVTHGSLMPFRIRTDAPSNSIFVDTDGDVGIGTSSPTSGSQMHIRQTDGSAQLVVEEASSSESVRDMMRLVNNGRVRWEMEDTSANGQVWTFFSAEDEFNISSDSTTGQEFQLSGTGDLTLTGDIITSSCPAGCGPDHVFEPDYPLMPLAEVREFIETNKHLPSVPSAEDRRMAEKMSLGQFQFTLLEKIEELTLYTLAQEEVIAELKARLEALEGQTP